MSADFLQSNLFSPTVPSERSLVEARWRKSRINEDRLERNNNKGTHSQHPPRGGILSHALRLGLHCNNNNNNNNHFVKNNNYSRGRSAVHKNAPRGNNNLDGCRSNNARNERTPSNDITPPMLTSVLEDGMARIPEPPKIPRQVRSSNWKSSLSTSRRERVRRCVSQSLPPEANLFAVTQETFSQDSQFQNPCVLTRSRDQSLEEHLTNLNAPIVDLLVVDASYMVDTDVISHFDQYDKSNVSHPEKVANQKNIDFDEPEEYDLSQRLSLSKREKEINSETRDKSLCLNAVTADINGDLQNSHISEEIYASSLSCNLGDLLQIQRDLHKMNLTKDKEQLTKSTLDKVNQSSFRETLGDSFTSPSKEDEETEAGAETHSAAYTPTTLNESCPSREAVVEYPESYARKDNDINCEKISKDQQKVLRLLHLLFRLKWNKNNSKKEDKMFLIEEEISELDGTQQNHPRENNMKKKVRRKQPLTERLPGLLSKWLQDRNKEAKLTEPSSTTKKKRRLRKKNVSRAGRRIRKRFSHGCRYIGHGLANMTSIIPEASYASPMGDYMGYSTTDYIQNDYYDPNAPAWNYHKGPYIRSPIAR